METVETYLEKGDALRAEGKWEEALQCYQKVIELDPENWLAHHHLGDALLSLEKYEEAIDYYQRCLKINTDFVWSYYNIGVALSHLNEMEEAFNWHDKIIEVDPEFWDSNQLDFNTQHQMGDFWFEQQQWEHAITAYQRAIILNPNSHWSYCNLGRIFNGLGKTEKAINCFQRAIEVEPNLGLGYYYLGETELKRENLDEAIAVYRLAYQHQTEIHHEISLKLGDAIRKRVKRDVIEALSCYNQVLLKQPNNTDVYLKALELKPGDTELCIQLGNILAQKNQHEQAKIYYQMAIRQPQTIAVSTENIDVEQVDSDAISQVKPELAQQYFELGKAKFEAKLRDEAVIWFRIAIDFNPNLAEAHFQLGNVLSELGNLDTAMTCYHTALELEPDNFWYYNGLGDGFIGQCEYDEAARCYRRAIELYPEFEGFHNNLKKAEFLQRWWQRITTRTQQLLEPGNSSNSNSNSERPLNILMVTPYPPYPPQTGGAIRMFEQIKYLGKRHHLTVVSMIFNQEDYQIQEDLKDYCDFAIMVNLGVPRYPRKVNQNNQIHRWEVRNMWKVLEQLSQVSFDAVLFDFIFSTPYHSLFKNHVTILNEHNIESRLLYQHAESQVAEDLKARSEAIEASRVFLDAEREAILLQEYENRVWPQFTLRAVVSEEDKQDLETRCPQSQTIVVKNGIDTQTIQIVNNQTATKVLYMGTMSYYPNVDAVFYFVEEILPHIREQGATIPFCIAGRDPSNEVKDLANLHSEVEVIANPENMSDVAEESCLTVVPLRLGSGTRIKILHAMAMGLPVISTSKGCEGLDAINGVHLLIREHPKDFAEAVINVSSDVQLRQRLRKNARRLVEEGYDWESIFSDYEENLRYLVKESS
jgi:tetratricopeptide (TPR) repeat protein